MSQRPIHQIQTNLKAEHEEPDLSQLVLRLSMRSCLSQSLAPFSSATGQRLHPIDVQEASVIDPLEEGERGTSLATALNVARTGVFLPEEQRTLFPNILRRRLAGLVGQDLLRSDQQYALLSGIKPLSHQRLSTSQIPVVDTGVLFKTTPSTLLLANSVVAPMISTDLLPTTRLRKAALRSSVGLNTTENSPYAFQVTSSRSSKEKNPFDTSSLTESLLAHQAIMTNSYSPAGMPVPRSVTGVGSNVKQQAAKSARVLSSNATDAHHLDQVRSRDRTALLTSGVETFPMRLHRALAELELTQDGYFIAMFLPDGQSFLIQNQKQFMRKIAPKFFPKMKLYTSFQRQLNLYNFQRIGRAYRHKYFVRAHPELSTLMKPLKIKRGPAFYADPRNKRQRPPSVQTARVGTLTNAGVKSQNIATKDDHTH